MQKVCGHMKARVRWLGTAMLALCLGLLWCAGAQAQDWQTAYAQKLQSTRVRRVIGLAQLSGSRAPELVVLSVKDDTASLKVYACKSGQVAACDSTGYDLDGFSLKNYNAMKIQLRSTAEGTPCLHIVMKGGGVQQLIALTSPSQGTVKVVFRAAKNASGYQVNGEKVTQAQYKKQMESYNQTYVKRGAVLPTLGIASSAANSTIALKVANLSKKYDTYTTLTGIKLSKTSLSLTVGKSASLTLSRSPASAIFEKTQWSSSDTSVATVDQSGMVTAVGPGKAVITAQVGERSKNCQVTVTGTSASVTGLTLDVTSATLIKGESLTLTATPKPLGLTAKIAWSSSKPKVASVDQNGVVLGLSKGTAVITAKTANGKTATCKIVVNNTAAVIVDISQHNDASKMDWDKIAKNVDLMILRCGVTRTETAPLGIGEDASFEYYVSKCEQYGIPFGVYYYGKCSSVAQAKEEAQFTWKIASPHKPLFYVYDVEESRLTKAMIEAYMTTLKSLGAKKTGYYIAHHLYSKYKLDTSLVDFIWLPHYGGNTGKVDSTPSYACDLHQYTSKGSVPGISGNVDLNRLMGGKTLAWFTSR